MVSAVQSVTALAAAMEGEIVCLEAYVEGQKAFAAALKDRDWGALQAAMDGLELKARNLSAVEAIRIEAEAALRREVGCPDGGFYHLALTVPEPERTELTDLFRKLKITAMRAKFENASASSFARENKDLLGGVLEELFPEKRGKIYGRSGHAVPTGHDSLVLNTAL